VRGVKPLGRIPPAVCTGLAGALICAPILFNGFTNWDDPKYILENPFFAAGWAGIPRAFTEPFDHAYYPVTQVLAWSVHRLAGPAPWAFHLFQLILFAGACALLPRALKGFSLSPQVALAATLLWLAHPFRVESTAWAANLKDATSLFFVVLAFALHESGRRKASVAAWVLGLLSKSMVAPLGLLFVGLELARARAEGQLPTRALCSERSPGALGAALQSLIRSAWYWVPAGVISVVAGVLHLRGADAWQTAPPSVATRVWIPLWYVGRLLWPSSPRAVYAWEEIGWADPRAIVATIFFALAAAWLVFGPSWRARAGAPIAAFLLALIPVLGMVPMGQSVAERYTLFASIPLAVAIAWGVLKLPRRVALSALIALCASEAVASVQRELQWRSALALWAPNLPLAPQEFSVRYNLAGALGGAGRFSEAHQQLLAAYALRPSWPGIDCALAAARAGADHLDPDWILRQLPQLCAAGPDQRWQQARALLNARDPRGAVLAEELSLGAHNSEAAGLMGAIALAQKDAGRALILARKARAIDPANEEAIVTEAAALLATEDHRQALAVASTQVTNLKVRAALKGVQGAALFKLGRLDEAQRLLDESAADRAALGP
jgi:tetratricopeptide (TPR) repeat protein